MGEVTRTPDEIVSRARAVFGSEIFGTEAFDLIQALPFERAAPFLGPDVTEDKWAPSIGPQAALTNIAAYMEFAWRKANDERGLSAYRSLCHMKAWLWLAGEDELLSRLNIDNYSHYGKPQLREICEHLAIDWRQYDNDRWSSNEGGPYQPADDVGRPS